MIVTLRRMNPPKRRLTSAEEGWMVVRRRIIGIKTTTKRTEEPCNSVANQNR